MRDIRIAAVQFEHRNADKEFNLSRIDALAADGKRRRTVLILDLQAVEFGRFRVGYDRMLRPPLTVARKSEGKGVVAIVESRRAFEFTKQREMSRLSLGASAQSKSERVRVE